MGSTAFVGFAGVCAVLTGVIGFLYAVAFVVIARVAPGLGQGLSGLFLALGGLLATAALLALYDRVRQSEPGFALWALLLTLAGALGSLIHGGFELATAISPPASIPGDVPSQIDPRGLLTFGLTGIGFFVFAWLMARTASFPRGLSTLGYAAAVLLLLLYLARLIIVNPSHPAIVLLALLSGFIVYPIWYVWLGLVLRKVPQ